MKTTPVTSHHLVVSPESGESLHSDGHNRVNRTFRQNQLTHWAGVEERKNKSELPVKLIFVRGKM